jgi:hypothetical protein
MYLSQNLQHTKHIKTKLTKTHLLTDELSLGAFISIKRFLIITSSPAQAAAALTSSSERPFGQKQIMNQRHVNDLLSSYRTSETI